MDAIAVDRVGGREEFKSVDLPEPKLSPEAILIRARTSAVNAVDTKIRTLLRAGVTSRPAYEGRV
jgi:NADPH:quinone reductase-like Zn-dependent oxidoreductase